MSDVQVKSKSRVADHGEVFTSEREVNSMLELVKQESDRIDSRFLEPACGNGNFLVQILKRKLSIVKSRYRRSQRDYEKYSLIAISSLYGVDLLKDNVIECRERLFQIFLDDYKSIFKKNIDDRCLDSIHHILNHNILVGNALTMTTTSEIFEPIVFSEWSNVKGGLIKRRDYTFSNLLQNEPLEEQLFSDLGDEAFIPKTIKEYPLIHFLQLSNQ